MVLAARRCRTHSVPEMRVHATLQMREHRCRGDTGSSPPALAAPAGGSTGAAAPSSHSGWTRARHAGRRWSRTPWCWGSCTRGRRENRDAGWELAPSRKPRGVWHGLIERPLRLCAGVSRLRHSQSAMYGGVSPATNLSMVIGLCSLLCSDKTPRSCAEVRQAGRRTTEALCTMQLPFEGSLPMPCRQAMLSTRKGQVFAEKTTHVAWIVSATEQP